MNSEPRKVAYNGIRVTVHSTRPFDTIMCNLYSEIGRPEQTSAWRELVKGPIDQKSFIEGVKAATGTRRDQDVMDRFMIFQA
jgi:hypothetical protein